MQKRSFTTFIHGMCQRASQLDEVMILHGREDGVRSDSVALGGVICLSYKFEYLEK
jgi:hypothetical protein